MPCITCSGGILDEYMVVAGLQSGQPLFQSVNSAGTKIMGRALNLYNAWAAIRKRAKAEGLSHPRWMSHLAGNRHHNLPGERRAARVRPTDGGTRVPANNHTLRSDKGRDYTERGGAHPVVTFDLISASLPTYNAFRHIPY
jgi:hypothetical protein